ncbi:unnamed protein product, partial [Effrenium voratum]
MLSGGLSTAAWCARQTSEELPALLQRCCRDGSHSCFDMADAVGAKCCRQDTDAGFYGFVLPLRSFSLNGTPHDLDSCSELPCLFSLANFQTVSSDPAEAVPELQSLGLLATQWQPYLPLTGTTSPILMDRVRVNEIAAAPIFYHRLFHDYAEVVPQGLWEYAHYMNHRPRFEAALAARTSPRLRGCEQLLAARARATADTAALPWLARRWAERGNKPFDSFVNIGAKDGGEEDPLHALLLDKAAVRFALAVEMNPEFCAAHLLRLPHVELLCAKAQRETMPQILARLPRHEALGRVPWLDVFKVDIDGADCDVAQAFLSAARAKLVVMEVYDGLPPPFRFALHESEKLRWPPRPPWGCSLSYQVRFLEQLGYQLTWFGAGNAIYVHTSVAERLGVLSPLDEVDCY